MENNQPQAIEQRGDMPGGDMNAPGSAGGAGAMAALPAAVERGVSRLVDDIVEQALEQVSNRRERGLVREALAADLRTVLTDVATREAQRQMGQMGLLAAGGDGVGGMAFGAAIETGMAAAQQVQNLGFVDFTKGLITGTFDAVIQATITQMNAYAKLVADLAKTLAQFQAENISDAEITAHLANRYPDGSGGTAVRATFTFQDTPANTDTGAAAKTANEKFQEVVNALIEETKGLQAPFKLTRDASSLNVADTDQSVKQFTAAQVGLVRDAMGRMLATNMVEHLRAMAREGMARIVITNGEILSKLTFNVTATSQQSKQASQYHQDSLGAHLKASAGWGWGSASLGVDYNQLNVRTVNESSFDNVTMSAEIIGQVKINFKTETFPPITTGPTA
jgi:hypothetical protein